ncbi:MAG: TerB family tellurite resistance protein [Myxococcales bacterium]|nr:TerB family tellurite resistance protein [Myxococcales bacterium]
MPQVDDSLQLRAGRSLVPGRPADDALLTLLASMACSDGSVHDRELDFLVKIRPDLGSREAVAQWTMAHAQPVDLGRLAAVITRPDDQWKALRFAARMAWKDGELASEERRDLTALAGALRLPPGAVDRVLREMSPDDGKRFTADRILRTLMDVHWDAVQLASGSLVSEDLHAACPLGVEVVARVGLEKVEVMALCTDGIVARFQEGAAFLAWNELVTYTREHGLGEALVLHTEDGRHFTLVDRRLSGLAMLLDRLLDLDGDPSDAKAPHVRTLRQGE